MKRYLIRLSLVGSLLCSILLGSSTKGQGGMEGCQHDQQQLKQHDGWVHHVAEEPERAPVSLLRPTSSHRVASSRSVRWLPTHGGKPSKYSGRWAKDQLSNLTNGSVKLLCICRSGLCTVVSSPRRYYVIALRRLLC